MKAWKLLFILIIILSGFCLLSKSYLKWGEKARRQTEQAKQEFSGKLSSALIKLAADFGKAKKLGKYAPEIKENSFSLYTIRAMKIVEITYGVTENSQLYRREGETIEILAPQVARLWLKPGEKPFSWELLVTGLVKIGERTEAVYFNYTLTPVP